MHWNSVNKESEDEAETEDVCENKKSFLQRVIILEAPNHLNKDIIQNKVSSL